MKKGADFSAPFTQSLSTRVKPDLYPYLPVKAAAASDGAAVLTTFLLCLA